MIKLLKLNLTLCLFLKTIVGSAVISKETAYEALKNFEKDFWKKQISPHYTEELERWTNTFAYLFDNDWMPFIATSEYLEPVYKTYRIKMVQIKTKDSLKRRALKINLSQASMLDIISLFYEILQMKVYARGDNYFTKAEGIINNIKDQEKEKEIDPYFAEIHIEQKSYYFCLNYDGGYKIKWQPGNCCLRQASESPQPWCIYGDSYNVKLNDDDHYVLQNLLFCLEVSRRHVMDPDRTERADRLHKVWKDKFYDLPILGAIVVGLKLMNDQKIKYDNFFAGKYRCFSKDNREENIKNLLETFCQYKNFQTEEQFLCEMQGLYEQFLGLKITDRVLCLCDGNKLVSTTIQTLL